MVEDERASQEARAKGVGLGLSIAGCCVGQPDLT